MKRRAFFGGLALVVLSGCAFSSEAPLFAASESAQPIEDGATYLWRERPSGSAFLVTFARAGDGFEIRSLSDPNDDPIRNVLFIPAPETPEEDFIVQAQLKPDDPTAVYAFMWRAGDSWRVLVTPPEEAPGSALCKARPMRECAFSAAADVRAYYSAHVHARYVAGAETPDAYLELAPPAAGADETGDK